MKKLLALLLALCMLLSLTACAETEPEESEREEVVEFEESEEEKSLSFIDPGTLASGDGEAEEEPVEEAEEEEAKEEEPAEEEQPAEEPAPEAPKSDLPTIPAFQPSGNVPSAFEETVLLDDEYCTVTLKGYDPDDSWGAELEVELVNKTDAEAMFAVRDAVVNGIMFDPGWACSVDAGSTETSFITFDADKMAYNGINYLQELLIDFNVYNNDDWDVDDYFEDTFTVLLPAAGSGAPNGSAETDFAGFTVVNNGDCAIAVLDFDENGYWGPEVKLMMINRSDEAAYFDVEQSAINGVDLYASGIMEVMPGTVAYLPVSWDSEDLEACGIRYVKDVRLAFDITGSESYDEFFCGECAFSLDGGSGPAVEEVHYDGFEDVVLLEKNGVSVVAKNFDMNGYWGPTLTVYLKNETDGSVWFDLDTAWVNGEEMDPYWSITLLDNTVSYSEIEWYEDDFAEAGITEVETIKLSFEIYDDDNWNMICEETVTLTLN